MINMWRQQGNEFYGGELSIVLSLSLGFGMTLAKREGALWFYSIL
jgi:hypothetical protein